MLNSDMKKMEMKDESLYHTHSYLALRRAVGWIGILLPFVLMLGMLLIFRENVILRNVSLYYHTGMRDVFVGSLCAIGLFLFFYKGYDRWDNVSGNLAGLLAFAIALFPTVEEGPYNWSAIVHFICAALFFIILSGISIFLFTRKGYEPTERKLTRNRIYLICGILMLACLAAILVFFIFLEAYYPQSSFVFWAETVALVAFGISWLTKGGTIYPDRKSEEISEP